MSKQTQMKYNKPSSYSREYDYSAEEAHEQLSEDTVRQKQARKAGELAVEACDDLLDEIDRVLESEEVVINFSQAGGQ